MDNSWSNPWKLTAIAMALMVVTAVVTGIVVANWTGTKPAQETVSTPAPAKPPAAAATTPRPASAVPPQAAIEKCNQYVATPPSQRDKTIGVVKDTAIGGLGGAAAGGAIAGGGRGAGTGAAIGGLLERWVGRCMA
jgi:ABC-type phosphate transport system substrate-binding protein